MTERTVAIVNELAGPTCRCGKPKQPKWTFCGFCYRQLPMEMQRALYKRLESGYVQAYDRAVAFLGEVAA